MFGLYGKRKGSRAWARGLPCALAVSAVLVSTASPCAAADIRLADDRLAVRIDPEVARETPFGDGAPTEVGLASMLRARTATPGPDVAVEVGHYGTARENTQSLEIDQRVGVHGKLSNILILPDRGISADVSGGYRVGDLAAFDTGTLETTFTLRASPIARLSTQTEIGWWGQRQMGERTWAQGGHARMGLTYALPGFGTIGAFERVGVSGARGHARTFQTGIQLDFGPHALSLSQRLETVGRVPTGPPATSAGYGWQVGPLGMALTADYTAESETAPASGFAGLAVTLGLAGPGPGALLDALR